MTTANKSYATVVTGTQAGLWGDILNSDVFQIIDNNMGGIVTKSLSSLNVTLSTTESQMAIVRLTGAILSNIQVTTSCIGFFFVENLTTGNFNITFVNDQIATSVVVPNGRSTVISDATNGCRIAGTDSFPSGTRMAFNQPAAPTGWVKDVSVDNSIIRLSSSGGGTGGSSNFVDVFAARTISKANLPNYSLPVSDPGHLHSLHINGGTATGPGSKPVVGTGATFGLDYTTESSTTGITVTSGGSGTAMDFAVKYCDFCVAVKS